MRFFVCLSLYAEEFGEARLVESNDHVFGNHDDRDTHLSAHFDHLLPLLDIRLHIIFIELNIILLKKVLCHFAIHAGWCRVDAYGFHRSSINNPAILAYSIDTCHALLYTLFLEIGTVQIEHDIPHPHHKGTCKNEKNRPIECVPEVLFHDLDDESDDEKT